MRLRITILLTLFSILSFAQTEQKKAINVIPFTASGTNTYTASISGFLILKPGDEFRIVFTNANTGASTLQFGSFSAIPIRKNGSTTLASGDLVAGATYILSFDGTNFQLLNVPGSGGGGGSPGGSTGNVQYNNAGSFGGFGNWDGSTLTIGSALGYTDTGILGTYTSTTAGYNQFILRNLSTNTAASANLIVNNDASTASSILGEVGINSSTFTGSGAFDAPSLVYIAGRVAPLTVGTTSTNNFNIATNSINRLSVSSAGAVDLLATAGNGYLGFVAQSSAPSTPSGGFRLYADASNRFSWKGQNGFVRTFDGTANTADRNYTLPNASGTVALFSDITASNAGAWALPSGGALTGANTISGAFNIGFTNTAIGLGVAPGSITANTRVEARGSNDLSTSFAFAATNNSGNILNRTTNDGRLQFGSNATKPFIGAAAGAAFDNTGDQLIFQGGSQIGFSFGAALTTTGSQNLLRVQGSISNNSTGISSIVPIVSSVTHSGTGSVDGFYVAPLSLSMTGGGTWRAYRNATAYTAASGSSVLYGFRNDGTLNTTGTYTGSYIGFDDSPTLTSTTGLSLLSYRGSSGMVLGHTGLTASTTRAQIRGTGTGSDDILLLENSGGISRFEVQGNGTVLFSGSAGTSGQVLTSAGASSPPTWTTVSTSGLTIAADATNADFTIGVNSVKYLPSATLSANRTITFPAGTNGDYIEIHNNETGFNWLLSGDPVYLSDNTTIVTQLLANANYIIRRVSGKWRIVN